MCEQEICLLDYTTLTPVFFYNQCTTNLWKMMCRAISSKIWSMKSDISESTRNVSDSFSFNMQMNDPQAHHVWPWLGWEYSSLSQRQFTMCKLQELDRWSFRRSDLLRCEPPLAWNRIVVWSLLGYLFGTYVYFGVHQFDSVLHILPVVIDVVHVGVSRVQAGKTTGDSAPEGICSVVGTLCAVELQRYRSWFSN